LFAQSSKPTMKAIVVHEYGGPEVLKYEEVPRPEPKNDQILIRVIAAGVNPVDASIRSGKFAKIFGTRLPLIPGSDIAGVVEKAGSKITKFKSGDSVFAYTDLKVGGGYAEYTVATEREASPKPKSLTYVEAAAVPIVALTAWQALVDTAKLSAGQTVLIHGGSGGVGSFAIQIAKARGAKVIATASTANQDLLKQSKSSRTSPKTLMSFLIRLVRIRWRVRMAWLRRAASLCRSLHNPIRLSWTSTVSAAWCSVWSPMQTSLLRSAS
jgi:NADPH:quinone reductase-like Zn-dependent oxidoreductase